MFNATVACTSGLLTTALARKQYRLPSGAIPAYRQVFRVRIAWRRSEAGRASFGLLWHLAAGPPPIVSATNSAFRAAGRPFGSRIKTQPASEKPRQAQRTGRSCRIRRDAAPQSAPARPSDDLPTSGPRGSAAAFACFCRMCGRRANIRGSLRLPSSANASGN
jgi:hypothetical protein